MESRVVFASAMSNLYIAKKHKAGIDDAESSWEPWGVGTIVADLT